MAAFDGWSVEDSNANHEMWVLMQQEKHQQILCDRYDERFGDGEEIREKDDSCRRCQPGICGVVQWRLFQVVDKGILVMYDMNNGVWREMNSMLAFDTYVLNMGVVWQYLPGMGKVFNILNLLLT